MRSFEPARLRRTILEMAYAGSSVHIACAFSLVEILAVLYRSFLNLGDGTPRSTGRDYLVLSKGHGVMAQYACMRELGWLTDDDVRRYFADGTHLKGLSDAHVPGLEATSGSLGHGLSVAVGLALGAARQRTRQRCFAIVGDGEINEGSCWEALLFASHYRLSNLIVIIDANEFQAMGTTKDVLDLGCLADKLRAFGMPTREVDGHDESALKVALHELVQLQSDRPRALVAHTIKGKGVSFMQRNNVWHYTRLTQQSYQQSLAELNT